MATKFKGKNLSFLVDGEEFNADGTSVVLDWEDADEDTVTFAEFTASGGNTPQKAFFQLTAVSDYAAGTFWSTLYDAAAAGEEIAFTFKPYGNSTPTTAQPHWTGEVTVPKKPAIGGEAGTTWTYESRLDCVDEPVRVTA